MIVQTDVLGHPVEITIERSQHGCISWESRFSGDTDVICGGGTGRYHTLDAPDLLDEVKEMTAFSLSHRGRQPQGPAAELQCLRFDLESGTGEHLADMEINAACLLYDVARYIGLSRGEIRDVLGSTSYDRIVQGKILHLQHQPCPFGATCSLVECLMDDCPRFGDRWQLVTRGNGRDPGRD